MDASTLTSLKDILSQSTLSEEEKSTYSLICAKHTLASSGSLLPTNLSNILESIPLSQQPSAGPLACLSVLLTAHRTARWPVFDLIRAEQRLWRALPESSKAGTDATYDSLVSTTTNLVKSSYRSFLDLFHNSDSAAIIDHVAKKTLTHRQLSSFVQRFEIPIERTNSKIKPVVVLALPSGSLLGITCIAVSTYYTAAPINSSGGAEQFRIDVQQTRSKVILALREDVERLALDSEWIAEDGIRVFFIDQNEDMTFTLSPMSINGVQISSRYQRVPNSADDLAFILFTSGTSGTKKVVPLTLHTIITGVAFVVESWALAPNDVCLNMMPLNHIGGIVRNLFSPILSGGSTILCSAFDPNLFWDIIEERQSAPATWYYASPSMHSMILAEAGSRPYALSRHSIRMVCNAAGGLLPSLAFALRDTFSSTVLPSYGMTECMPIAAPPLSYTLDRPGTSGISTGPEMAILDGNGVPSPVMEVGRINVRGGPVFPGYLTVDNTFDTLAFGANRWFDTGDMGYLDKDGYLYVTGRSKEVINRGGELISPFEVEEAIMTAAKTPDSAVYGLIKDALAFSVVHDVLQEVVGIVLAVSPETRRPDLRMLQAAVKSSLHSTKWPVVIVYMDAVPKKNNKVLRIGLGTRLSFEPLTDDIPMGERHFAAVCPGPEANLKDKIAMTTCSVETSIVSKAVFGQLHGKFDAHISISRHDGLAEVVIAPHTNGDELPNIELAISVLEKLRKTVDGYLVPRSVLAIQEPLPYNDYGVDSILLDQVLARARGVDSSAPTSETEAKLIEIFATLLSVSADEIHSGSDFFEIGGDSLKAGRLMSLIRTEFNVRLVVGLLFNNPTIGDLCKLIEEQLITQNDSNAVPEIVHPLPGCDQTYSSTNPFLMILQLVPIFVFYPMKIGFAWVVLMQVFSWFTAHSNMESVPSRFLNLIGGMAIARIATQIMFPLIAICLKWLIVGKYREGMYPMWGPYHTRWWMVEKFLAVAGRGIFVYFGWSRTLYLRLLGAKIGRNVIIDKIAELGEYDLIEIGDNVVMDECICRPFGAERNTSMYLGKITIGKNSSVGLKSIVHPGATIPPNICIGPNSSSHELQDATESNRDLSNKKIVEPDSLLIFLGIIIRLGVHFVASIPWMAGLYTIVLQEPGDNPDVARSIIFWFASGRRVGFHYLARGMDAALRPVVFLLTVIVVKKILDVLIGKWQPGPMKERSQLMRFKRSLMAELLPRGSLGGISRVFGSHYEITSMAVRALGGKVGSRVYWPGTGPSIADFDMVDIGNNVVFGSRSHLVTSDNEGTEIIRVGDNAMIADRVVLLPGAQVGSNTILGSGALARRNGDYPSNTVWVGSKQGGAICLTQTTDNEIENVDEKHQEVSIQRMSRSQRFSMLQSQEREKRFSHISIEDKSRYRDVTSEKPSQADQFSAFNFEASTSGKRNSHRVSFAQQDKRTSLFSVESIGYAKQLDVDDRRASLSIPQRLSQIQRHEKRFSTIKTEERPASSNSNSSNSTIAANEFGEKHQGKRRNSSGASSDITLAEGVASEVTTIEVHESSPFGRAFYEGKANYFVLGMFSIFLYTTFITVFTEIYWNVATVSAVQFLKIALLYLHLFAAPLIWRPLLIYAMTVGIITVIVAVQSILALGVIIAAKWALVGRRKVGKYDWDTSSYCQRWQVLLTIEKLRTKCFSGNGILKMLSGTHYVVMYFRCLGANIGKDCALFSGGSPSLVFTEPDLLTLGDRVNVDDASLVAHINSRGNFSLNALKVGDRSVLRSGSRLLSGAEMGEDSCLLEHTLIMAGDVVESRTTMQGWPAEHFSAERVPAAIQAKVKKATPEKMV